MKKSFFALTLLLIIGTSSATPAAAKVQYGEGEVVIGKNEVISDDLYLAAQTVRVEGKVEGDLYTAGENIFVTGEVTGDLTAIGESLTIEGKIGQDAYLIGRTIELSRAKISDSLHTAGQSIIVSPDTLLGGSFLSAGETLTNDATVSRSLLAAGRKIRHNAPILGEARLAGESLTLGPKTTITRDLTYYLSPDNGKLDNQAEVRGQTNVVTEPAEWRQNRLDDAKNRQNFVLLLRIWSYLGMLLVGGVSLWLLSKPLNLAVTALHNRSLPALGTGLLVTLLTPPALILLGFTVIGLPLALTLFPLYLIMLYFGKLVVALALARTIGSSASLKLTPLMEMFIGVTLFHLLRLIPVGGHLLSLLMTWIGVGAIYLSLKKTK